MGKGDGVTSKTWSQDQGVTAGEGIDPISKPFSCICTHCL